MNGMTRFERDLPDGLIDLAAERRPDYLDDAFFGQMADIRQRPAWVFPERWFPMDSVTTRAPTIRLPWRAVGILAMIALLIAAAAAVYVGSTSQRVPAPFGQAANGLIAYAENGDIHTVDPATGLSTALTSGPEIDMEPVWSRDGTRLAFLQTPAAGGRRLLFTVSPDGAELTQLTPEALVDLRAVSYAPDGQSVVAIASIDGRATAILIPTDGSGVVRTLDVPLPVDFDAVEAPSFRPPDGAEILIVGVRGASQRGLFAFDVAGGDVRTILEPKMATDIFGALWSPDGSMIAYGRFDTAADAPLPHSRVIAADGSGDVRLDQHPESTFDGPIRVWSNDGTRLVIARHFGAEGIEVRAAIVPVDRSGVGVEITCPSTIAADVCGTADWVWAPDDSVILGTIRDDAGQPVAQLLADPTSGEARIADWPATTGHEWQRVAP